MVNVNVGELQKEVTRLRAIRDNGFAGQDDLAKLAQLEAQLNGQAPAAAQAAPAAAPQANGTAPAQPADGVVTAYVNPEAFDRGWGGDTPPTQDGIFPGICTGADYRSDNDLIIFRFRSAPGSPEVFNGGYVCAAVSNGMNRDGNAQGAAGKVKDALAALGAESRFDLAGNLSMWNLSGRSAQVLWTMVEVKGKKERRIQDVYPASQQIEHAV